MRRNSRLHTYIFYANPLNKFQILKIRNLCSLFLVVIVSRQIKSLHKRNYMNRKRALSIERRKCTKTFVHTNNTMA